VSLDNGTQRILEDFEKDVVLDVETIVSTNACRPQQKED
jgi:hypothetical protein